jgi:hypothetical protein
VDAINVKLKAVLFFVLFRSAVVGI